MVVINIIILVCLGGFATASGMGAIRKGRYENFHYTWSEKISKTKTPFRYWLGIFACLMAAGAFFSIAGLRLIEALK
jgi:hypothetical protein